MEKTRLKPILRRNPWLRAFAFRQPLDPGVSMKWAAHLEFGAYGGFAEKTLQIPGRPNADDYESGLRKQPEYDQRWMARPRVAASRATGEETGGGVATISAGDHSTVRVRLTFHGLPNEVQQCLAVATVMLAEHNVPAVCDASGNDKYQLVLMSFEAPKDTAFRVFNRLIARVPSVTVALEHDDPATGKPMTLRAVEGRIDCGRSG